MISNENVSVGNVKSVEEIDSTSVAKTIDEFNKFSKLVEKQIRLENKIKEYKYLYKDNKELQDYIQLLTDLDNCNSEIDIEKKNAMYDAAVENPNIPLENNLIKITLIKPYEKYDFNREKFIKKYAEDSDVFKEYMTLKTIKGHISYKIK